MRAIPPQTRPSFCEENSRYSKNDKKISTNLWEMLGIWNCGGVRLDSMVGSYCFGIPYFQKICLELPNFEIFLQKNRKYKYLLVISEFQKRFGCKFQVLFVFVLVKNLLDSTSSLWTFIRGSLQKLCRPREACDLVYHFHFLIEN